VVNQGQAKANPSKTNVRLSPSPDRPTKDDPLLVSFDTPALDPNQSVTHEAEVTITAETKAGDYYVWVIVDVDSTAGQSDESNDRIKAPLKVKAANRPPVLTKIESPPDKGVATGQPWFRMQAEDPDGNRVTYRIELKYYSSPPSLPSTFPTPDYVFDQKAAESKGWWMPGDEWRQTENRRVQSGAYASGAIAQFQPKAKLPEGYYLWRVIVTDEKGAVYEMPREKWKTFRVIHHNPIVLVHGFDFAEFMKGREGTNPGNWNEAVRVMRDEFGYTPLYNSYNKDNDQPEGSPNPYADLFVVDNLDTSLGVEPNAERMRIYMSEKVRPRLSYKVVVDLIGHSMGGLISRAYVGEVYKLYRNVRGGQETAVLLASIGKEVGVERIVTIGTPHSGAPLADIWMKSPISSAAQALVRRLLGLPSDVPVVPVIYDLSMEGACKKINPQYPVKDGIEYLLFAGELSFPTQVAVNTLWAAFYVFLKEYLGGVGLEMILGSNDGIVPWWSAYWLYDCIPTKQRLLTNNVKEILPAINMGNSLMAHFNLINETTTRQWMREYIKQVKGQGGFTKMLPVRRRGETIEIPEVSPLWQGVVHQGETLEHPVYLDARSDATFLVNWLVGQLSLELQSPTGETITPNQAQQGSGIEFYEIPTIWGNVKMFIVKNASQGRWVMKVRGESEVPPDGTPALMWAAFHSPLKLNVEIPKAIYSVGEGGRAVLKAQLMKASQPVTGATVTAEVIQPDGQSVTVNLLDDGEHQDGKAGDGVYGAVLTNLTEPGTYRFIVTAKGQTRQEGGTNFERSAMGSFEVASPAARLTGRYTDEGMDEDNDGLFERLRVDVQVQIQQAGSFTLSGALADGAGRIITQTSVSFEATEASVMTISLSLMVKPLVIGTIQVAFNCGM
jgi:pimeloyl-ACP methyl ester carboxylesterase